MRFLAVLLVVCSSSAYGLSFDASALSSSNTRQAMVSGAHIATYPSSQFEVSGKYVKSEGREDLWDAGIDHRFSLDYGLTVEDDIRFYHTHTTFAGGIGVGYKSVTLTGGMRTEFDERNASARDTFLRGRATLKYKRGWLGLTAYSEVLRADQNEKRLDYKVAAKIQPRRLYVAVRVEEIRHVKLQGVSLGVSF